LFNHGTRHEALIAKGVSRKFKKVVNYKFKNEKQKKKTTCYNYVAKGHFTKKCSKKEAKLEKQIQKFFTS
jgi:hypothetical protein